MALKDRLKPRDKELQGAPRRRSRVGNGNGFSVPGYPGKGEPSHYTPDISLAMRRYFADKDPWEIHMTDKGAAQLIPKDKMPTFTRFAALIGFSPRTFDDWKKRYPDFAEAYEDCKEMQKAFIFESGGITLNGGFATWLLKCNHGMKEPVEEVAEEKQNITVVIKRDDIINGD